RFTLTEAQEAALQHALVPVALQKRGGIGQTPAGQAAERRHQAVEFFARCRARPERLRAGIVAGGEDQWPGAGVQRKSMGVIEGTEGAFLRTEGDADFALLEYVAERG